MITASIITDTTQHALLKFGLTDRWQYRVVSWGEGGRKTQKTFITCDHDAAFRELERRADQEYADKTRGRHPFEVIA